MCVCVCVCVCVCIFKDLIIQITWECVNEFNFINQNQAWILKPYVPVSSGYSNKNKNNILRLFKYPKNEFIFIYWNKEV